MLKNEMLGTVAHAYNPSLGRQRVTDPWPTVELQADCRYFSKKRSMVKLLEE